MPVDTLATQAGKGRTGVMLACYMLYAGLEPSACAALEAFGRHRTADGKGVTIPSQRRYVAYFAALVHSDVPEPEPESPLGAAAAAAAAVKRLSGQRGAMEAERTALM